MSSTQTNTCECPSVPTELPRARPPADILETDDAILVHIDVPGVQPEGLEITEHQGRLSLEATPAAMAERCERGEVREWSPRRYVRSFQLPSHVDAERIDARIESGVLTLTIPKIPESTRRIEVRTS